MSFKETGAVIWEEFHTPFGESILSPAANDNQADYTGHIRDSGSGLTYMQARYYDPVVGRFLGADPVNFINSGGNPVHFNAYAYVRNDPINFIDPDGKYARGSGWSDDDWQKFEDQADKAEKFGDDLADDLDGLADAVRGGGDLTTEQQSLKDEYNYTFGDDKATSRNLRSTARAVRTGVRQIRKNSSVKVSYLDTSPANTQRRGQYNRAKNEITMFAKGMNRDNPFKTILHEGIHAGGGMHARIDTGIYGSSGYTYQNAADPWYAKRVGYANRRYQDPGYIDTLR